MPSPTVTAEIGRRLHAARQSCGRSLDDIAAATRINRRFLEEIEAGDEDKVFYAKPVHQKIIIMLGGPTMNLLLAFVLFAIVLVGIGIPQPTTQVDTIAVCTPTLGTDASGAPVLVYEPLPSGECPTGTTASPASTAGLRPGDTIAAVLREHTPRAVIHMAAESHVDISAPHPVDTSRSPASSSPP